MSADNTMNMDYLTELSALYEISSIPTSLVSREELGRLVLDKTTRLLGVPMAILYHREEDGQTLKLWTARGVPAAEDLSLEQETVTCALREGQPVVLEGPEAVQTAGILPASYPVRHGLCLPIRAGSEVRALLCAFRRADRPFTRTDLALFSVLGDRTGTALENMRLFAETERRYRELLRESTQRRQTEEALRTLNATLEAQVAERTVEIRAEQEKNETILRNVADAIVMIDEEMCIRYVNPAFTALTGYTADEVLGQGVSLLLGETLSDPVMQSLHTALTEGEVWRGEVVSRRKDGRTYDAALTIAPMRDAAGRTVGGVSSHRDISRLKELERARQRFMTNVSHELRTPLANIKLYIHLLQQGRRPERTAQYLQVLREQAGLLEHLVQDILEMTKLDSGQGATVWKPVSLFTIIDEAVTRVHARAKAAGLSLVAVPVPPDLPTVRGDQARLGQALAELAENAVAFTAAGGRVTIRVGTTEQDGQCWVTIAVHDTGPGISRSEQERIFDRFFRGSLAESGHIPGTGLGLSIVEEIMRAHGGRVTVESPSGLPTDSPQGAPGQGSTFTLWLRAV